MREVPMKKAFRVGEALWMHPALFAELKEKMK
jgi:hypothetical protein